MYVQFINMLSLLCEWPLEGLFVLMFLVEGNKQYCLDLNFWEVFLENL
jgi:hypothetical protein